MNLVRLAILFSVLCCVGACGVDTLEESIVGTWSADFDGARVEYSFDNSGVLTVTRTEQELETETTKADWEVIGNTLTVDWKSGSRVFGNFGEISGFSRTALVLSDKLIFPVYLPVEMGAAAALGTREWTTRIQETWFGSERLCESLTVERYLRLFPNGTCEAGYPEVLGCDGVVEFKTSKQRCTYSETKSDVVIDFGEEALGGASSAASRKLGRGLFSASQGVLERVVETP